MLNFFVSFHFLFAPLPKGLARVVPILIEVEGKAEAVGLFGPSINDFFQVYISN